MLKSRPLLLFAVVLLTGSGWYFFFFSTATSIVNNPPRPGPIVALGDSLTLGVGARPGQTYPEELGRLIGRPVVNAGVGGNTIDDAAARLDKDVLPLRPAIAIVLLGGNDFLQRKNITRSFHTLEAIIRRLQERGAMVVLVDPWFMRVGPYSGRYARLARRTGCVLVPHVLRGILTDANLRADAIHPNSAGYKLMSGRIAAILKPYVRPLP